MRNPGPYISFTFDDFPRSAWHTGGSILEQHGLRGTYYASMGLMGRQAPTGLIFNAADLDALLEHGHEVGCHTYSHCDSWATAPKAFERSIEKNHQCLTQLAPGTVFRSFSYPICGPRPFTKWRVRNRFQSCRGGGQTFNVDLLDLNYLLAYFLEKSRGDSEVIRRVIDRNREANGWLIFATHDVDESPTPYGCTPQFFEQVVRDTVSSGARILPVSEALDSIRANTLSVPGLGPIRV